MPDTSDRGHAVIECFQCIPCNPCTRVCKTGAITMASLASLPEFHPDNCIGCRLCVAACPGQAIFFVRDLPDQNAAEITFPYEYLPCPREGQMVTAADRNGKPVCQARVTRVDKRDSFNGTMLVTLTVPLRFRDDVRFLIRNFPS